jgi:hypothetical protein
MINPLPPSAQSTTALRQAREGPGLTRLPRPANPSNPQYFNTAGGGGFGQRSMWPYPPIGEAQRRDPHVGDPVPFANQKVKSQAVVSPPLNQVTTTTGYGMRPGGGIVADGFAPGRVYLKSLGGIMQRTLGKNFLSAIIDARWRVGGVSYPPDFGYGPGYHGDAATVFPNNPQTYLRNPGIIPLTNVPTTYRYAPYIPGTVQSVGPSIADVYNFPPGTQVNSG